MLHPFAFSTVKSWRHSLERCWCQSYVDKSTLLRCKVSLRELNNCRLCMSLQFPRWCLYRWLYMSQPVAILWPQFFEESEVHAVFWRYTQIFSTRALWAAANPVTNGIVLFCCCFARYLGFCYFLGCLDLKRSRNAGEWNKSPFVHGLAGAYRTRAPNVRAYLMKPGVEFWTSVLKKCLSVRHYLLVSCLQYSLNFGC